MFVSLLLKSMVWAGIVSGKKRIGGGNKEELMNESH